MSNFTRVCVFNGEYNGFYELPPETTATFGRGGKNFCKVRGAFAGEEHCRIVQGERNDWLESLGDNITLLNGQPVKSAPLADKDILTIGSTAIYYMPRDYLKRLKRKGDIVPEANLKALDAFYGQLPAARLLGRKVDIYLLAAVIGATPDMDVYLGVGPMGMETFAVKLLKTEAPPEVQDRFAHSAAMLKNCEHENIVGFIKVGECDGRKYCVARYINGLNLARQCCDELARSQSFVLSTGVKLLDMLEYLHKRDLAVRNLSPENVMVGYDGSIKLTNLEYATKKGEKHEPLKLFQRAPGAVLRHRPPEYTKASGTVQIESDLFTLASILYECLSGVTPWEHPSSKVPAGQEKRGQFAPSAIVPLSARVAGLHADMDKVFGKALAQEPAKRFRAAGEFRDELKRILRETGGAQTAGKAS